MKNFFKIISLSVLLLLSFAGSEIITANAIGDQTDATAGTFEAVLCNGYRFFTSTTGKVFALFALIALGISFFLGKVSWGTVIAIALGIGVIFGGSTIVNSLASGASTGVICSAATTQTQ